MPRATRALAALRGQRDSDVREWMNGRNQNLTVTEGRIKLAELELLRATCETVGSPIGSGYDDLLIDSDGRVYDERTGEPVYSDEIVEYARHAIAKEPCYGDVADYQYETRNDR